MFKINIILFTLFLLLSKTVICDEILKGVFTCNIKGNNGKLKIYKEVKALSLIVFEGRFLQIGTVSYSYRSCECDTSDGSCILSLKGQDGEYNSKLFLKLQFTQADGINVYNKSLYDILKNLYHNNKNKIHKAHYCDINQSLYFSNLYFETNKRLSEFYGVSYANVKSIVEKNYNFPLYYDFVGSYGKLLDGSNERKRYFSLIGSYDIRAVRFCKSKDYEFSPEKTETKEYSKNGSKYELPACNSNLKNSKDVDPFVTGSSGSYMKDISKNGQCGSIYGICPGSGCCSQWGYCGTSSKHCGSGCQADYGNCSSSSSSSSSSKTKTTKSKSGPTTSPGGRCGKGYGICPGSECCSEWGYCGTSSKHCGSGCQADYGNCSSSSSSSSSSKTKTTKSKSGPTTSPGGRCGKGYGICPGSECCSEWGYCGTSSKHCGSGCQSNYGKCK